MQRPSARSVNCATEIAAKIAAGEATCESIVRDCVKRIAERDDTVKAWVNFDPYLGLARARALDHEQRGGPLHGVPIGVKDIIDRFDMPTEMGSPIYRGSGRRLSSAFTPGRRDYSWQNDLRARRHGYLLQGRVRRYRCGIRESRACRARGAVRASRCSAFNGRPGILAQISDRETLVWASTQKAHDLRTALADYIDLDESHPRVATPDVGGGFGPKLCVYPEDVAVVAAAILLGRSIKWIEDRREHFTNAAQERDQYWSIELAADADGRVRGLRGRLIHDIGAHALQDVNIPYNSATSLTGPYVVPALAMDVDAVHSSLAPVSSVRGAGYPQA